MFQDNAIYQNRGGINEQGGIAWICSGRVGPGRQVAYGPWGGLNLDAQAGWHKPLAFKPTKPLRVATGVRDHPGVTHHGVIGQMSMPIHPKGGLVLVDDLHHVQ